MKPKDLCIVASALAAGYLGGVLSPRGSARASSPDVVSASKFVLVNAAGAPVAIWELGSGNSAHLVFLGPRRANLALGVASDNLPYLEMNGQDAKNRLKIGLVPSDKPYLAMSDDRWQGRVTLGFIPPDTIPYPPNWDEWGLMFRTFGSARPVAGIGMMEIGGNPVKGFLTVHGIRTR